MNSEFRTSFNVVSVVYIQYSKTCEDNMELELARSFNNMVLKKMLFQELNVKGILIWNWSAMIKTVHGSKIYEDH